MTPDPFAALARSYQMVVRRHRRQGWARTPEIAALTGRNPAGVSTDLLDRIVDVVRAHRVDVERSDQAVRALVAIESRQADAFTVVLHALGPALRARLRRATSTEYKTELLGDLALVIRDAARTGDLATQGDLVRRLTNRAHSRGNRRITKVHDLPWDPAWLGSPNEPGAPIRAASSVSPDPAEHCAARVDLQRFVASARQAVAVGDLSAKAWRAYQAHRLGGAVTDGPTRCTNVERVTAARAAHKLQRPVAIHLSAHAT